MNLLYDFYGQLLTEKQQALIALYYQADLSLGEIADQQEVSRQAVYDILKRSERTLEDFESKLRLIEKHRRDRLLLQDVEQELAEARAQLMQLATRDEAGRSFAKIATRLEVASERLKSLD